MNDDHAIWDGLPVPPCLMHRTLKATFYSNLWLFSLARVGPGALLIRSFVESLYKYLKRYALHKQINIYYYAKPGNNKHRLP